MKRIWNFLFLPLALILYLLNWFFMNYEVFPQSRTSLSFVLGMILVVLLLLSILSIFSIPLIYLFRKRPHRVVWQTAFLGISIICFTIFLGGRLPQSLPTGSNLLKFDSAIWKADEAKPLPKDLVTSRQKMLKDLVENVLLNKSREEIVNLLGQSTETSNFRGKYDLIYRLGPERDSVFGLDYEWLLIHLKDEKFKKYSVVID